MREGLIILPRTVHEAHHMALGNALLESFGGYTVVEARGAWRDPADGKIYDEPVAQYLVSYEPTDDNHQKLSHIADVLLNSTKEQAIYFKFSDGTVKIIHK